MSTPRLRGPWDAATVERFLDEERSPLRLAVNWSGGVPLVVSLWFVHEAGALWCASHRKARLTEALMRAPEVGFDVSVNDPPYRGVRGQGRAHLLPEAGAARLETLLDRYLGDRESNLARWLLSRAEDEVAIRIEPTWLTSWDFSARMGGA